MGVFIILGLMIQVLLSAMSGQFVAATGSVAATNGAVPYASLQQAIDAAGAGDTISLQSDIMLDSGAVIAKPLTVLGNGKMIKVAFARGDNGVNPGLLVNANSVTLEDVVIESTHLSDPADGIAVAGRVGDQLTDVRLIRTTTAGSTTGLSLVYAAVTIDGVTTSSSSVGVDVGAGAHLVITGRNRHAAIMNLRQANTADSSIDDVDRQYVAYRKRSADVQSAYYIQGELKVTSPSGGGALGAAPLVRSWTATPNADHYVYESYLDQALSQLHHTEVTATTSDAFFDETAPLYWWRVKAVDADGFESDYTPPSRVELVAITATDLSYRQGAAPLEQQPSINLPLRLRNPAQTSAQGLFAPQASFASAPITRHVDQPSADPGADSSRRAGAPVIIAASSQGWKLVGIAWFWWVLGLGVCAALWSWLAATYRRLGQEKPR